MHRVRNDRKPIEGLDFLKFFLFDVLVASFIGIVAWLITGDQVSSFIVSLVVSILLLLVEMRFQVASTRHDLATYAHFDEKSMGDPKLRTFMHDVLDGYTGIANTGDVVFLRRAQKVMEECSAEMSNMREGFCEDHAEEVVDLLLNIIQETKKTVCATSVVKMADYWGGGSGKEWVEANFTAIRRGVKITRIFIIESVDSLDQEGRAQIEAQRVGGIDVRIALANRIDGHLIVDMGLFDDHYYVVADFLAGLGGLQAFRLHRRSVEVERGRITFERILRESEDARTFLAKLPPLDATVSLVERPAR